MSENKSSQDAGAPPIAPDSAAWRFRHSLRSGRADPLLHAWRALRGDHSALTCTPAPEVSRAAPRVPIDLEALHHRLRRLPALPEVVHQALAAIGDETSTLDDCARQIERDPGLTASTLRLANSAFFGVASRVGTVREAIDILGTRTVGMLLTAAALATRFGDLGGAGFRFTAFCRHAAATATAARAIAPRGSAEPTLAFVAGLLHDIGRLALAAECPDAFDTATRWAREADLANDEAERAVLGVDHAAVGAALAADWRLPAAVVAAIAGHHAPAAEGAGSLADVVHVADAVAHAAQDAVGAHDYVPSVDVAVAARLNLGAAQIESMLTQTAQAADAVFELITGPAGRAPRSRSLG